MNRYKINAIIQQLNCPVRLSTNGTRRHMLGACPYRLKIKYDQPNTRNQNYI